MGWGDVSNRGSKAGVEARSLMIDWAGPTVFRNRSAFRSVCVCVFVLASFVWPTLAQETLSSKNVLVMYSFTAGNSFPELEPLKSSVRARLSTPVNFYVEYLDSVRFSDPAYRESLSETLHHAYSGTKLDLVVVGAYPALRFAVDYRDRVFPGVPIVFVGVDASRLVEQKTWPGVTGLEASADIHGSVDLALRFHPETQRIALIGGVSEFETYWNNRFREEMRQRFSSLKLIELVGLPPRATLDRIAALPEHTIVFVQIASQDSAHPVLSVFDLIKAVSQRFPTYSIFNYCFDHGCLGGSYSDQEEDGRRAGRMAARILSGESPESIPLEADTAFHPIVDWRQLQHWRISESAVPPGTLVLYREPTFWLRYRRYIGAAVVVIAIQFLLILSLLRQQARKRKVEAVLRESEKRFQVMADTTPSLIWMCDEKGNITYLNEQRVAFTGEDPHAGHGQWKAYVHPDDLKNILDTFSWALKNRQPFSNQYRLRRRDGIYRWVFDVAAPRLNGDGSFAGFIGSAVDVSDQKMAQESLEKVSGQLIAAQEKERSHLARELHDDICQRLAMLSLRIEKATKSLDSGQLEQIWKQCSSLTADVQALSHELHPSILDNLGLVTAVRSFCREVSEQNGAVVEFAEKGIPSTLPREVSLSLFRVIQEALHNALKYSGQKHFKVLLQGYAGQIELEVSDRGAGFDPSSMKNGKGLGLVSMTERIHLLNGTISIHSKPSVGTSIRASVPLPERTKVLAASAN
jgi:PAS domain S-box-containing protein